MIRKNIPLYILILLILPTWALADLKVVWMLPKKDVQFIVEYRDLNTMRMGIDNGMYLLILGEDLYAINEKRTLDVHAFGEQLQDMWLTEFFANRMQQRSGRVPPPSSLRPLNREETVAGVKGEVYEVTRPTDKNSTKSETYEIVLTEDPRLVELKLAMKQWMQQNSERLQKEGFIKMQKAMQSLIPERQAIIRYSDRFTISEITDNPIAEDRFQLPPGNEIRTSPTFADVSTALKVMMPLARD
jgi:hypothetical protein